MFAILFLSVCAPSNAQVMQFKYLHLGENCSGGVVLWNENVLGFFLTARSDPIVLDNPVLQVTLSAANKVAIPPFDEATSDKLTILKTTPESKVIGLELIFLKERSIDVGHTKPELSDRRQFGDALSIGSYVSFRNCEVDSLLDRQTADVRRGPVQWSDTPARFARLTGLNSGESSTVWVSFDVTSTGPIYENEVKTFEKTKITKIFSPGDEDAGHDFSDDGNPDCYTPSERATFRRMKLGMTSVEQCSTWLLSGVGEENGEYVELQRDLTHAYFQNVESLKNVFVPVGRSLRAETEYLNGTARLSHQVKSSDPWQDIGTFRLRAISN